MYLSKQRVIVLFVLEIFMVEINNDKINVIVTSSCENEIRSTLSQFNPISFSHELVTMLWTICLLTDKSEFRLDHILQFKSGIDY